MTTEQETFEAMKVALVEFSDTELGRDIEACIQELKDVVNRNGTAGLLALAYVGAEIAAEEDSVR